MTLEQHAIEFAKFVRDASVRLNDAQAVSESNKEMLAEELTDMEDQARSFLERAAEIRRARYWP